MTFLTSIAIVVATRLGYKLAEQKKWLPARVYLQMTLDKLSNGDLRQAIRLNDITLKKRPDDEKALIVKDLIAMRRDAILARLRHQINLEQAAIEEILANTRTMSHKIGRMQTRTRLCKIVPWLFLFVNIFAYLVSYLLFITDKSLIACCLVGGCALACTVLFIFFFRYISEKEIQARLQKEELTNAQQSKTREFNMRNRRLRELQSKLYQTRHQLWVK